MFCLLDHVWVTFRSDCLNTPIKASFFNSPQTEYYLYYFQIILDPQQIYKPDVPFCTQLTPASPTEEQLPNISVLSTGHS